MSITADDLVRIVTDVWRDVLALEVAPAQEPEAGDITGCIQITGAFRGAVVMVVPRTVARTSAAGMFALADAEIGSDEERDAIGELTNMVGGHVKSMVASPSQLALPAVVPGNDHCLDKSRLQLLAEQAIAAPGGSFLVRVYEDIG